jgi:hypothetical protein
LIRRIGEHMGELSDGCRALRARSCDEYIFNLTDLSEHASNEKSDAAVNRDAYYF